MSGKFTELRRMRRPESLSTQNAGGPEQRVGRPPAKRSDPAFRQVTAYVRRDTYAAVRSALFGREMEFSELVQELLEGWVRENAKG